MIYKLYLYESVLVAQPYWVRQPPAFHVRLGFATLLHDSQQPISLQLTKEGRHRHDFVAHIVAPATHKQQAASDKREATTLYIYIYIYIYIYSSNCLRQGPLRALEERLQKRMYFLLVCLWLSKASCERGCNS